jgi:hypothetical protein
LDFNGAIGNNLSEKLQIVYVTLVRMQYITRKTSGMLPDVLLVQPLVNAMFECTGILSGCSFNHRQVGKYQGTGVAWSKWNVYLEEDAWMEHHILMTNLDKNGEFYEDPKYWCKVSLLNLVMSNNFGYFNMC